MAETPNPPFRLGTFAHEDGGVFVGVEVDDAVWRIEDLLFEATAMSQLFEDWNTNLDRIEASLDVASTNRSGLPVESLRVLPPIHPAGPILAAGANYRTHILEMSVAHKLGRSDASDDELWEEAARETDERGRHGDPYVWTGLPSAVCGAYDDVQLPDVGEDIDWELELGVVIGSKAHRVAQEEALSYVAGYTIVNDLTARSLVPRPDMTMLGTDWFRSKNQPTFFPTGPYLVPSRYVPDPDTLRIELRLNGEVMQDATADDMLFNISALISYVSSLVVLHPGDLLITGSPAGNGSHWGRFLTEGDVLESRITGLGVQRNAVRGPTGVLPPWQESRRRD